MLLLDIHIGHGALVREFLESVLDVTSVVYQPAKHISHAIMHKTVKTGGRREIPIKSNSTAWYFAPNSPRRLFVALQ